MSEARSGEGKEGRRRKYEAETEKMNQRERREQDKAGEKRESEKGSEGEGLLPEG